MKFLLFIFVIYSFILSSCKDDDFKGGVFNNTQPDLNNNYDLDPPCTTWGDADGDTISDSIEGCYEDTDHDGIANYADTDSDNDGISDKIEAGDVDPDTYPINSDGDGMPDYIDLDSDNDGIFDGDEDRDGNGVLGSCGDICNPEDQNDTSCGEGQTCTSDSLCEPAVTFLCSQGESDPTLVDTDNDGILDSQEGLRVCHKYLPWNDNLLFDFTFTPLGYLLTAIQRVATVTTPVIQNPDGFEGVITHKLLLGTDEIAGFSIVKSLDSTGIDENSNSVQTRILSDIPGEWETIHILEGRNGHNHIGYESIFNIEIVVDAPYQSIIGIRDEVISRIFDRPLSDFSELTPGGDVLPEAKRTVVLSIQIVTIELSGINSFSFLAIDGAVVDSEIYNNPEIREIANDIASPNRFTNIYHAQYSNMCSTISNSEPLNTIDGFKFTLPHDALPGSVALALFERILIKSEDYTYDELKREVSINPATLGMDEDIDITVGYIGLVAN
jgi:hypothetical protein